MVARVPHSAPAVVTVLLCALLAFPTLGALRNDSISAGGGAAGATAAAAADQSPGWQPFEENRGQADPGILFLTRGDGYAARFDADGFDLLLAAVPGGPAAGHLRVVFADASGSGSVVGEDPSPGVVNYVRGASPSGWIAGVRTFGAVKYLDLYPGIDLTISGDRRQLMLRFDLGAGSDPGAVTLQFDEDARTEIDPRTGDLLVGTAGATARLRPPAGIAFALESGAVTWSGSGAGPGASRTMSMTLDRDRTRGPPGTPAAAPGPTDEEVTRVAVDGDGGTFVTGRALTVGADGAEAFVAQYDRGAKRPSYTTYFGGSGEDMPLGLVVTADHEAIVSGWTRSADFPIANALQPALAGASGAFVIRLSADGATPVFSTYLGGGGDEEVRSVALDEDGAIWIAGRTRSFSSLPRPASKPVIASGLHGGYDALVAALAGDGSRLLRAVDMGGIGDDEAQAVGLDGSNRVWIAGSSTSPDFPAPAADAGPAPKGAVAGASSSHAFVVSLDPDSLAPSFVSRIESGGAVTATGLAVGASGEVFVAGRTDAPNLRASSEAGNVEVSMPAGGPFIAILPPAAEGFLSLVPLGGGSGDAVRAIAAGPGGGAWIAGGPAGFVVKIADDGHPLARLDEPALGGVSALTGIAVGPGGRPVVAGIDRMDGRLASGPGTRVVEAAPSAGVIVASPVPLTAGCPGTIEFDNSAGTGLWQTATNWSTDVLPGPSDDVCIPAGMNVTLSLGTQAINSFYVETGASLTVSAGTLSFAAASQVDGTLTFTGGTLGGAGDLTLANNLNWSGGQMNGSGTTYANGGIALSGSSTKDLSARVLDSPGTTTWTGTGYFRLGGGAVVHNTGLWDSQGDTSMSLIFGTGLFDNQSGGTFQKSAGTGATSVGIAFDNEGTLSILSGTVALGGGGTATGSFTGSAGTTLQVGNGTQTLQSGSSVDVPTISVIYGTLDVSGTFNASAATTVSGGTLTLHPAATLNGLGSALAVSGGVLDLSSGENPSVSTLTLSGGTLQGTDALTVSGLINWTAGTMAGSGITNADGGMTIGNVSIHDVSARTLNTAGTTTWSGTGLFRIGSSATVNNTGVWDCQTDATMSLISGTGLFDNQAGGTFQKSAGTGTTTISVPFNNEGTLSILSGTIALNGNGTSSGSFTGSVGTTLLFGAGTSTLQSASSVDVAGLSVTGANLDVSGTVSVSGTTGVSFGTATFHPAATVNGLGALVVSGGVLDLSSGDSPVVPTFAFSGGTLQGTDTLTITGLTTWTGGFMTGTGATNTNGGMAISGTLSHDVSGRVLTASGTTAWTGTGGMRLGSGAAVRNTGTWDFQSDITISLLSGTVLLDNQSGAILQKSAGTGTTTISIPFDNEGTVSIQSGTLALKGGGSSTGSFTGSAGATLQFGGGTHTMQGGSSLAVPTIAVTAGTVDVSGTYDVATATSVSGGTLTLHPAATLNGLGAPTVSSGILDLSSGENPTVPTLGLSGGTLQGTDTLTISGLTTWTGGTLSGSGITNADGDIAISGTSFHDVSSRTLNTAGTTTWSGTGSVRLGSGATVHNTGTWDSQADTTMSLLSGTVLFDNQAGGIFQKSAGTGTTTVSVPFNNEGTASVQSGIISLSGGGTATGSFAGGPGATLKFGGGTYTLQGGSSVGVSSISITSGTLDVSGIFNVSNATTVSGGTTTLHPAATLSGLGALAVSVGTLDLSSGESPTLQTLSLASGNLQGTDSLTVSGLTTWTGGTMSGTAVTNTNGGLSIGGSVSHLLTSRILNTAGTSTWAGGAGILLGSGAAINNTGVWDCQTDLTIGITTGGGLFDNQAGGTFKKSAGAGTTTIGIPFDNEGTVSVQSGTIALTNSGTATGSFTGTAGTTLRFAASTYTLQSGSIVDVSGLSAASGTLDVSGAFNVSTETNISGGTVTLHPAATLNGLGALAMSSGVLDLSSGESPTIPTFSLTGGILQGTDTLTVSGLTTWTNGSMSGAGVTDTSGGLAVSGAPFHDVSSRTLNTAGTTTWTGSGGVRLGSGASIHNTGVWDCQGDAALSLISGSALYENQNGGTFQKSAGSGATTILIPFTNEGSVRGLAATLSFTAGYTQTGGSITVEGGVISASTALDIQGGIVGGAGTFNASVTNSGHLSPGLSPGIVGVTGNLAEAGGANFDVEIGGLTPGTTCDQAAITGTAALGGALNVSLVNGWAPADYDLYTVMTFASSSGTFASLNLPVLPGDLTWKAHYDPTSFSLEVLADLDGDGVRNASDCAPSDPTLWSSPAEVSGTAFASDGQTLSWDSLATQAGPATVYDAMRGVISQLPAGSGAAETCLASSTAAAQIFDNTIPAAGEGFYYLERGVNGCGTGTYGYRSIGTERTPSVCP